MPIFVVLNRYLHTYEDKRFKRKKTSLPKFFLQFESWKNKVSKRFALRTDFNLRAIDGSLTSNTYKEKGLEQMPFCQFIPKQHLTF